MARIECTIVGDIAEWGLTKSQKIKLNRDEIARSILNTARMYAPELTGALKAHGRVEILDETSSQVIFGDTKTPYARLRHYVNNKNPHTKYYLSRAGETVSKQIVERLKG